MRRPNLLHAAALLFLSIPVGGVGQERPVATGDLVGRVVDASDDSPLGFSTVALVGTNRGEIAHADGSFHFHDLAAGEVTVRASFLGYAAKSLSVRIAPGETTSVTMRLERSAMRGREVVVTADRTTIGYAPESVIAGERLEREMATTLAATLAAQPGVAMRSSGGATPRPVVRGLGGDRLQILQDGEITGDLSATSTDHAVTIDPLAANRIDIVQGPEALIFTSNALGGVVDVVSERVPTSLPDRVHGSMTLQGESGTRGGGAALDLFGAAGPVALRLDGIGRTAGDRRTPAGPLLNSGHETWGGTLGASYPFRNGFVGASGLLHRSRYEVPGGFVGAHPSGVSIESDRRVVGLHAEASFAEGLVRRVVLKGGRTRFHHLEIEAEGVVGTEYGVVTTEGRGTAEIAAPSPLQRLVVSVQGEHRDFAAGRGGSIPATIETALGATLLSTLQLAPLSIDASLRGDLRDLRPEEEKLTEIGAIGRRSLQGWSAGLALSYSIDDRVELRASLLRTWRAPTVEELYSGGPHLAAYSYEIGNPSLDPERGLGTELALRYESRGLVGSVMLFRNRLDGYIHSAPTGDTNLRTLLPVYQTRAGGATFIGADGMIEGEIAPWLVASVAASYVVAEQDDGTPLPSIPPASGRLGLRYESGPLSIGAMLRGATAQSRVAPFEAPTEGYVVGDLTAGYRVSGLDLLHAFSLVVENVLDAEYRDHLNRVRATMPEGGRSLRLLYRLYF